MTGGLLLPPSKPDLLQLRVALFPHRTRSPGESKRNCGFAILLQIVRYGIAHIVVYKQRHPILEPWPGPRRRQPRSCTLAFMSPIRIAGVIPARLSSTRLSRKVLREIAGRPMVEWVWRAAAASGRMDPVVVATDAEEVAQICRDRSIPVLMTSPACASGSDRVREAAQTIEADVYVNIQGDEPTLTPEFFAPLLALFERPEVEVATLSVPCAADEINDPNAVKVVVAHDGRALYFSRAPIPYDRDQTGFAGYRKHLGIYAYRKAALTRFAALAPSPLERTEKLEQLRLLENGIAIHVAQAPRDTVGVDTEEDLQRAEALLRQTQR
jgi:3-deoxy-manno-octulosonate cytidylyltransferase (CMP-KDO synthetase)